MKIKFLGAHNCESATTKLVSLLVDGVLALDAGGLTSSLSIQKQLALKGVLLTHYHYDHVRDIPALAMNALFYETSAPVYSTQAVREALAAHFLNGTIYSEFLERPPENPRIRFTVVQPLKAFSIEGYTILPVPVVHSVPATGYQVTSPDGRAVFYSGDTGPGLSAAWQHVSPQVLITEVTAPNRFTDFGRRLLHLTPDLLKEELLVFRQLKGYLPAVVLVHMNPRQEREIAREIAALSIELEVSISLAYEGLLIQV